MTFLTLTLKNIWRVKTRTALTVLGVAIGVATIVTFGLLTSGMEEVIGGMLRPGTTDFTVVKAGSADVVLSFITEDQVGIINQIKGVDQAVPVVMTFGPMGANPYFMVTGLEARNFEVMGMHIKEGRVFEEADEILIGNLVARNYDLSVGDTFVFNEQSYNIVGIFESGTSWQDTGALTGIAEAQRLQGISGNVNMMAVVVKDGHDIREVAALIEEADSDLAAVIDVGDYEAVDQGKQIAEVFSWAISLLAVVIGGIGVMNTIIMSVFERTREIGVLRAVGWRRSRVAMMIVMESVIIGLMAVIPGILMGLIMIWLVRQTELGQAWLIVNYDPAIFLRALLVAVLVVLAGALYPAYKASRLLPVEALRHE